MNDGNTGYPWSQGDPLLAADLNAAIANSVAVAGGMLPLNGSAPMTGPLSLSGNATLPLHAVPLQQLTAATAGGPFLPLTGGTVAGDTSINTSLTVGTSNKAYSGATWQSQFWLNTGLVGTTTAAGLTNVHQITINGDTLDASGSAIKLINYMSLNANFGGAAMKGNRQGIGVSINLSSPSGNLPNGGAYVGIVGQATASSADNGTGLTRTTAGGSLWGANFYAYTGGAAANFGRIIGAELNPAIGAGTSALGVVGIQVVPTSAHQVRGAANWDVGYLMVEQVGAAPIDIAYAVGDPGGQWPIRSDGSLFRGIISSPSSGAAARHGVLLNEISFPAFGAGPRGGAFVSNAFAVDGLGAIQCGPGYFIPGATGLTIDARGSVATGTPTVAAGGAGYTAGDVLYDDYGGVYVATVSAGTVTAVTVLTGANGEVHQAWWPSHVSPPSPVTTKVWNHSPGAAGCTLNLTWDTSRNALILQNGAGPTTIGGTLAVNGVVSGTGFTNLLAPYATTAYVTANTVPFTAQVGSTIDYNTIPVAVGVHTYGGPVTSSNGPYATSKGTVVSSYGANSSWASQLYMGDTGTATDLGIWYRQMNGSGTFATWYRVMTGAGGSFVGNVGFNNTAAIAKPTGWGAATGTATRSTFVTTSVTLPTLAEHVKALIDDLIAYGLIGP